MSDENPFEGELMDIEPPRDVVKRAPTSLQKLTQLGEEAVERVMRRYPHFGEEYRRGSPKPPEKKEYQSIIWGLLREQKPKYTESDFQDYVLAMMNQEREGPAKVRGIVTGALLHLLTVRNRRQGKRTRVHLNGHGGRMDYLCMQAGAVDELIIENFRGKEIASGFTLTHPGSVVVCRNVRDGQNVGFSSKGIETCLFDDVEGNAGVGMEGSTILFNRCIRGKDMGGIGSSSTGDLVVFSGCTDSDDGIGRYINQAEPFGGLLLFSGVEGKNMGGNASAQHLVMKNVRGDYAAKGIRSARYMMLDGVDGNYAAAIEENFLGRKNEACLLLRNVRGIPAVESVSRFADDPAAQREAEMVYERSRPDIDTILALCGRIQETPTEGLVALAREIHVRGQEYKKRHLIEGYLPR